MQLTPEQFKQIEGWLPRQRGNVSLDSLQVLNAICARGGQRLQVAGAASSVWQLAHHLHAHDALESLGRA